MVPESIAPVFPGDLLEMEILWLHSKSPELETLEVRPSSRRGDSGAHSSLRATALRNVALMENNDSQTADQNQLEWEDEHELPVGF